MHIGLCDISKLRFNEQKQVERAGWEAKGMDSINKKEYQSNATRPKAYRPGYMVNKSEEVWTARELGQAGPCMVRIEWGSVGFNGSPWLVKIIAD